MIVTNFASDFDVGYITRGVYKNHPTDPGIYTARGVLPAPGKFTNNSGRSGFCSLLDTGYVPPPRSTQAALADTSSQTVWDKPYLSGNNPNLDIGIAPGGIIYTAPDGSLWYVYLIGTGTSSSTISIEVRFYPFGEFGKSSPTVAQTVETSTTHTSIDATGYETVEELDVMPDGSKILVSRYARRPVGDTFESYLDTKVMSTSLVSAVLISISGVPPSAAVTLTSVAHDGDEGDLLDINGGITFVDNKTYGPPAWEVNTQTYSKTTTSNGLITGCFLRPDGSVAYMGARFALSFTVDNYLTTRDRTEGEGISEHPIYQRTPTGSGTFEYEVYIDATIIKTFNGSYSYAWPLEEMNVVYSLAYVPVAPIGADTRSLSFDGATTTDPAIFSGASVYSTDPGWWYSIANELPSGSYVKFVLRHPSNNMFMFTKYAYTGYLTPSNTAATATLVAYGTPGNIVSAGAVTGVSDSELLRYGSRNPETGESIVAPYSVCYV